METLGAGLVRFARSALAILVCTLAAHAAAYRSFVPRDSVHGYLGAYDAAVGGLSATALAILVAALAALLVGRRGPLRLLAPSPERTWPFPRRVATLASASLALLVVQERLERVLPAGPTEQGGAGAGAWFVALVAIVLAAAVIILLDHSCGELVRALLAARVRLPRAPVRPASVHRSPLPWRRRNSLADFRGLRAPPALSG